MLKLIAPKMVCTLCIVLLMSCASDQSHQTQQVNNKEKENEEYLEILPLHALSSPSDIVLPHQSSEYDIPLLKKNGMIGKDLDIYPPT